MRDLTQVLDYGFSRIRGGFFSMFGGIKFQLVGRHFKYYGIRHFEGRNISVGDACWFEAVTSYQGVPHQPRVRIGDGTRFSRAVTIACVERIDIGRDCLFGSNIYVGDHSHGSTDPSKLDLRVPPVDRPLDDVEGITIGERVWIGNGAVILAGTSIADGSIIGANSVVRGEFLEPALIAGIPAKVIRRLE